MPGTQDSSCLRRIRQLVIFECLAVADRVGRPGTALLIHQCQENPGVEAATQKNPHRHITQQMPPNRRPIQVQQLVGGFFVFLRARKRNWRVAIPTFFAALPSLNDQHRSRRQFANTLKYR